MSETTAHDADQMEQAVLAILGGTSLEDTAHASGTTLAVLSEAIERYRAAGRAALDTQLAGWFQVTIHFADYPNAEHAFRTHLLPALTTTQAVGAWWFLRKYPNWRLRAHPAEGATIETVAANLTHALDTAVARGAVRKWTQALYEPEHVAFGGTQGMDLAHALFHTDSVGVLDYLRLSTDSSNELLDANATSILAMTLLMRAARLELGEQGDVWGLVEGRRPITDEISPTQISGMAKPMRHLLLLDARPLLATGPLAPVRTWVEGLQQDGRALAEAAEIGKLALGPRRVLARHILFHWNRMGFTTRQQAIWSRAAREAALGAVQRHDASSRS